jgi:hypothetical protein
MSMTGKEDLYFILEVDRAAPVDDIKRAFESSPGAFIRTSIRATAMPKSVLSGSLKHTRSSVIR